MRISQRSGSTPSSAFTKPPHLPVTGSVQDRNSWCAPSRTSHECGALLGADLKIRRMMESESKSVVELWHATKKDAYPYLPLEQERTLEDDSTFFHENLLARCDIWVAEEKERLAGFFAIQG